MRSAPRSAMATVAVLSCAFGLLGGCAESSSTPIDIEVILPKDSDSEAERVEVFLVNSCEELTPGKKPSEWVTSAYALRDGTLGGLRGNFPAGTYGLYGVAQAGDCAVIAQACIDLELRAGQTEPVTITLAPWSGEGCPDDSCSLFTGQCELEPVEDCAEAAEETSCIGADGVNGLCRNGNCCTGCWANGRCETGDLPTRCGIAGAGCQDCFGACSSDVCIEGQCTPTPAYTAVSTGEEHSCAIADTGKLYCWGASESGELGIGAAVTESCGGNSRCMTLPTLLSFEVEGEPSLWSDVSAGQRATCGILSGSLLNGSLWCWGSNDSGRMAAPAEVDASMEPYQASAGSFVTVELEGESGCAIGADDSLWCWGDNSYGQANPSSPGGTLYGPLKLPMSQNWLDVAMGSQHVCAIEDSGVLWCWGLDGDGQVGDGEANWSAEEQQPIASSALSVAAFRNSSCVVTADEGLQCWGQNSQGKLGIEDESGADVPIPTPVVTDGHSFAQVSGGETFACGITETGELFCWGREPGQFETVYVPTRVGNRNDWVAVSAGHSHACAIQENGSLWCWGRNNRGQLGLGDRNEDRMAPERVCGSQSATIVDETGLSGPSSVK